MPLRLLFCLLVTMTTTALADAVPNPLIPQRADPWVYKHTDGFYYFTASVPEYDRIELRRAQTLAGLATAEKIDVWKKHPTGVMGEHIWAPELHFIDDRWYVYFAAGAAEDKWAIRIFVLSNDSPNPLQGQWKELGQLKTAWESFSLDATTFKHRGRRYLVWAQNTPGKTGTDLYLSEMKSPTELVGPQVAISTPELPWEIIGHRVNEGPAVLVRNDRLFVAYSASATDANYCVGLLSAEEDADLLDPAAWKKSPQPVFASSDATGIYGPGHNSFTTDEQGRDVFVYHARSYKEIKGEPLYDPNRHARVQSVEWRKDGMPYFGVPRADDPVTGR